MKEVFEKILERLEESATCEDEGFCNYCQYRWCPLELVEREEVEKIIREVAKEYNNGWIPCSERLPENVDFVLFLNKDGEVETCTIEYFYDYRDEMIAWQPLPKPYKPKEGKQYE